MDTQKRNNQGIDQEELKRLIKRAESKLKGTAEQMRKVYEEFAGPLENEKLTEFVFLPIEGSAQDVFTIFLN